jgi:HlyD family secretion protein
VDLKKILPVAVVILTVTGATLYFEVFRNMGTDKTKIEGSGTIEVTEIDISSKIAGRVEKLPEEEGISVKKGDLLVELEYDELSAQKYSTRANLVNAEANLRRIRDLYREGSSPKQALDNAEAAWRVAKANDDLVQASIENAVIYSPIDGVILEKNLEIGEMAFPGTAILTMADLDRPWIKIYVDEAKLGLVRLGQKADLRVDTYPALIFTGKVVSISDKAEFTPKTIQTKDERVKLMFAVKIAIDNPAGKLKPGMPADVDILLKGN